MMNEMLAAIRCMLVSRGRAPRYGTFSSELCCGLSLSRRVQNNRMNENRCPEGSKDGLEGRTQCTKQHEKYLKMYPKSLQIVARRGPKSKEIVVWRGLWVHSGMFGAFQREFYHDAALHVSVLPVQSYKLLSSVTQGHVS